MEQKTIATVNLAYAEELTTGNVVPGLRKFPRIIQTIIENGTTLRIYPSGEMPI